jgi:acyl-coenzyme A thioesterase PaaI-like protein
MGCNRQGALRDHQSQFIAAALAGDMVTCRPEVVRKTREIVFMRGDFKVDGKVIFSVTAVWRTWAKV